MSVEQSSQLILLIMNSALMMLLSAALLGGIWLKQNALLQQLQQTSLRYQQMVRDSQSAIENQQRVQTSLKKLRNDRTRLTHQYTWSRLSLIVLNAVLLIFGLSLFLLALRSLLAVDSLISSALFLFTLGSVGLFASMSCLFVDIVQGEGDKDSLSKVAGSAIAQTIQWVQNKHISKPPIASSERKDAHTAKTHLTGFSKMR